MLAVVGNVVVAILVFIGGLLSPPPAPAPGGATVTVTPETAALHPGDSQQLTVVVLDGRGQPITRPGVVWTTSSAAVATVSASGLVRAVAPGTATVTATSGRASDTSVITVTLPNTAPTVTITGPSDGSRFLVGAPVTLTATASDAEDGALSAAIQWSNGLTALGTGGSITTSSLPIGDDVITATVTDAQGLTASASITVRVAAATPPTLTVDPAGPFLLNQRVVITGTASDAEDGDLTSAIQWTLGGTPVGTGGSVDLGVLTPGLRTVTASVTDADGHTTSVDREFRVLTNQQPVLTITSPAPLQTYTAGVPLTFSASAIDPENGDVSSTITWTARYVSGPTSGWFTFALPSGPTITTTLARGTYEIRAQGSDDGFVVGLTHRIYVAEAGRAPTLTITTPTDGSTFTTLQSIAATATAHDADGNDLTGSIRWLVLSPSGAATSFGTGGSATVTPRPIAGTWTLMATVEDGVGVGAAHQIALNIVPPPA